MNGSAVVTTVFSRALRSPMIAHVMIMAQKPGVGLNSAASFVSSVDVATLTVSSELDFDFDFGVEATASELAVDRSAVVVAISSIIEERLCTSVLGREMRSVSKEGGEVFAQNVQPNSP
jgi:hypothetical protein